MAVVKVKCPYCGSDEVSLFGKNRTGRQRYLCRNQACGHKTFQLEYKNNACRPGMKEKIVDMVMNGAGTREHKNLDELLALLEPFSIGKVYTDNHFAYQKRIPAQQLITGKKNTQKIERDHLTLRTRIKRLCRKTICFSKSEEIHKAVVGTFINIAFFGRDFDASTIL